MNSPFLPLILKCIRSIRLDYLLVLLCVLGCKANAVSPESMRDQRLIFESTIKSGDYRLTLGSIKNINATAVAERERLVSGAIYRRTYEFRSGLTRKEAQRILSREFPDSEYQALFTCSGLDCGSSNTFANDRFGIKELYGLDATQRYQAMINIEDRRILVSLYFVQRGNKRIYAQIDRILMPTQAQTITPSYSVILEMLDREGYYSLPMTSNATGYVFEEELLVALVHVLRKKPLNRFYIVGHNETEKALKDNMTKSQLWAEMLYQKLIDAGIKKNRLQTHALGSLAPRPNLAAAWVDIVIQ